MELYRATVVTGNGEGTFQIDAADDLTIRLSSPAAARLTPEDAERLAHALWRVAQAAKRDRTVHTADRNCVRCVRNEPHSVHMTRQQQAHMAGGLLQRLRAQQQSLLKE